jgi:hypothetical protein
MIRAFAIDEISLLFESLTPNAIEPLIDTLIDISLFP